MAYQVPKSSHPWRQYKNRIAGLADGESEIKVKVKKQKTVKLLITEFAESWDSMKVVTTAYGRDGEFLLSELPQEKQAAWLAGILRRNYA